MTYKQKERREKTAVAIMLIIWLALMILTSPGLPTGNYCYQDGAGLEVCR